MTVNTTALKIESNDLTITTLFKDFYTVPDFQREFVWERENVEKLLQDIQEEFYDEEKKLIAGSEYFLGSVVVTKDSQGVYQLIDGQQRMTTIYLILCVARDAFVELGETPTIVLQQQISDYYSDPNTGEDIQQHRLTLQYEDSDRILEKIVSGDVPVTQLKSTTNSVRRILTAYKTIRAFYSAELRNNPAEIRKFLAAFTNRIKLIRILTPSVANALKVFETINDRGVGLNAMDLLKNLLFMKTHSEDYPKLKNRWKKLVDILDKAREKPLRFLRYYIMSHHETDTSKGFREDEIYDWFVKNSHLVGIDQNPLRFTDLLIECANAYSNFLAAKDVIGTDNRYLSNIALLSGALRQQFILLLAARNLEPELFSKLCQGIENLIFCYIIIRESTKTFEKDFAKWASELRSIETEEDLDAFLEARVIDTMRKKANVFEFAFRELKQDSIQQYRMRYILAKLTQFIEEKAWGNPTHAQLGLYMTSTVEVEHILNQTPTPEQVEAFDKKDEYNDYLIRLGNLSLLEKTINASISNKDFEEKLSGYKQSSFLLTKSIAEKPQVGYDTSLNRAVADLKQFDHWDSETIVTRQEMLTQLAKRVWNVPVSDEDVNAV